MKASIFDAIIGLVLIFIIAVSIIIYSFSNNIVMEAFVNNTATNITQTRFLKEKMEATFNTFNYGFLIAFVSMWVTICILAYYSDYHPLFFILSIIVMIASVFFSFFLSNAYWDFIQSSTAFQTLAEQYWVVTHIMKHLPFYTTGFNFLVAFVTYMGKKGRFRGE